MQDNTPFVQPDVWHQSVHKKHEENLYYVFVGLTRPAPDLLLKANNVYDAFVNELRENIIIEGLSIYSLFGSFDTLIRIWCKDLDAYKLFIYLENSDLVRHYKFYWCKQCQYLWAPDLKTRFDKKELTQFSKEHVYKIQEDNNIEFRKTAIKNGFLLPQKERTNDKSYVKFFSHIPLLPNNELHGDHDAFSTLWEELKNGVINAAQEWRSVQELTLMVLGHKVLECNREDGSKYVNDSNDIRPAVVLVKGIVPGNDMAVILPFTFAFASQSYQLRGASETYLVASAQDHWFESDSITISENVEFKTIMKLKEVCGLTSSEIITLKPERCN